MPAGNAPTPGQHEPVGGAQHVVSALSTRARADALDAFSTERRLPMP